MPLLKKGDKKVCQLERNASNLSFSMPSRKAYVTIGSGLVLTLNVNLSQLMSTPRQDMVRKISYVMIVKERKKLVHNAKNIQCSCLIWLKLNKGCLPVAIFTIQNDLWKVMSPGTSTGFPFKSVFT